MSSARDYARHAKGMTFADIPVTVKPRSRAGSWNSFESRYQPIPIDSNGELIRHYADSKVKAADERNVWTVVDVDGVLYVVAGYATVNYMGRILTRNKWSDIEQMNPGYKY